VTDLCAVQDRHTSIDHPTVRTQSREDAKFPAIRYSVKEETNLTFKYIVNANETSMYFDTL
jgi:hypothetical protein